MRLDVRALGERRRLVPLAREVAQKLKLIAPRQMPAQGARQFFAASSVACAARRPTTDAA